MTTSQLNNLNIRSAMNSGADVLGKFYEVFLKYGNGAKEIGIVLTPRHITRFAVSAINVSEQDIVFDPACGTGGFLVAAFDHVKRNSNEAQIKRFKENNIFGLEQEPEVVALAIVNMIFRGDGKNKIVEGNCFNNHLIRETKGNTITAKYSTVRPTDEELAVTKVLMNPPFALKSSDEKEYKFVEQALSQMQDGGILFSVLPYSVMVKSQRYLRWRRDSLLAHNTLLSVVTFPPELFYPIGVHAVGLFVKKGFPHQPNQPVLWVRAIHDGLVKIKGKRLPSDIEPNDFTSAESVIKSFVANPNMTVENILRFQKACPIDYSDHLLELVPENYLDQEPLSDDEIRNGIEQVVRNSLAYLIQHGK